MLKRDIIIFSAGKWCESAILYYSQFSKIKCLVDNNRALWGNFRYGYEICSPEVIGNSEESVIVIANEKYEKEIRRQIVENYGSRIIISFRIKLIEDWDLFSDDYVETYENKNDDELIIEFSGGLGNQMFQYAYMCYLRKLGKNTTCDFSRFIYIQTPPHLRKTIKDIYKKTKITRCNPFLRQKYKIDGFNWYKEPLDKNGIFLKDDNVLRMKQGYVSGYFQAYQYANCCKEELIRAFSAPLVMESKLRGLANEILKEQYVSIHLRLGDYLQDNIINDMGDICTKAYYHACIMDIKDNKEDVKFVVFSNDDDAKKQLCIEGALYISAEMFDRYDDWYDIYLMSLCKHNIIANSSFSWWGAWLNQNPSKMVYRPEKWTNSRPFTDICPPEWIKVTNDGKIIEY